MNKIILATILALGLAPQAQASLAPYEELLETVNKAGVSVYINPPVCFGKESNFDGYYHSTERVLVVCQDNAKRSGQNVAWTDNDLDTIRHEVHHMVQDCVSGTIADGQLGIFFDDKETYVKFVTNSIGEERARAIVEAYSDTSAHTRALELEAFSVAETVSPGTIKNAVAKFCF